jgi:hypothetical protein
MNFNDKISTKKGTLGEQIADRYLCEAGYHVYHPADLDNAHPIDRIAVCKRTLSVLLCDVKSKPKRLMYPDTGIDMSHWLTYWTLAKAHNMRVYLVFVDEDSAEVYGQFLHVLEKPIEVRHNGKIIWYPLTENKGVCEIRYFPIRSMHKFGNLTADEQFQLQELSTRHQKYEAMKNKDAEQGTLF